jgi:hypothetical protein
LCTYLYLCNQNFNILAVEHARLCGEVLSLNAKFAASQTVSMAPAVMSVPLSDDYKIFLLKICIGAILASAGIGVTYVTFSFIKSYVGGSLLFKFVSGVNI